MNQEVMFLSSLTTETYTYVPQVIVGPIEEADLDVKEGDRKIYSKNIRMSAAKLNSIV